ncbi:hypothetical protein [Acaryochloris sp. IP29b_bin.148]|nr:hypothetical protein [Acaryochloris sp. IP29b_bin.148]
MFLRLSTALSLQVLIMAICCHLISAIRPLATFISLPAVVQAQTSIPST